MAAGGILLSGLTSRTMHTPSRGTKVLAATPNLPAASTTAPVQLRVLHVVNRLDLGGTETGILKVIAGLGAREFTHGVCTAKGHSPEFAQQHALDGRLFDAAGPGSKFQFLVYRFAKIMKIYRPHIVHSRNWGAIEALFAARLAGVPIAIHSEHGYELDMLQGIPLRRRLVRRAAYATADAVFTVSSELREYHARQAGVSPASIRVLANGVDSQRFAPRVEKKLACRASLGLPQNSFLIGTVGRLVPIKAHDQLLHAARILIERGLDLSVAVAGDGPEFERLRAIADSSPALSGRVHLLGALKNVPDLLNAMDVFVLPSVSEGMSNTLLEAMSAGLPVVATRVGGNQELIEDRISGLLFTVGNLSELIEHLSNLAGNSTLRAALGASSRARILDEYRLDSMLDRYSSLYRELAVSKKLMTEQVA
jgi:sugar transferase (PEP-CTERM/EpsH1 system associated)